MKRFEQCQELDNALHKELNLLFTMTVEHLPTCYGQWGIWTLRLVDATKLSWSSRLDNLVASAAIFGGVGSVL